MKRRLMIAKALAHEPQILFLDEPTAGVDVELRRDMWRLVRALSDGGVTIILTTHYIDEAEEMADRIGVISKGRIILVEDKAALMRKLGRKQLTLELQGRLERVPEALAGYGLELSADGNRLTYTYDTAGRADGDRKASEGADRGRAPLQGSADERELTRGDFRHAGEHAHATVMPKGRKMNFYAVRAIYFFEDGADPAHTPAEHRRTGNSTSLYFVVSGRRSARGSAMSAAWATAPSSSPA